MATDKLYTVAGVSTLDGETKVRFATDIMRIKVLAKHGHTDINLVELENPMSKLEAVRFLKTLDEFQGVSAQSAIADYLDRKDEKPAKVSAPKTAKAPAKAKASKATAPKATVPADAEDAPF